MDNIEEIKEVDEEVFNSQKGSHESLPPTTDPKFDSIASNPHQSPKKSQSLLLFKNKPFEVENQTLVPVEQTFTSPSSQIPNRFGKERTLNSKIEVKSFHFLKQDLFNRKKQFTRVTPFSLREVDKSSYRSPGSKIIAEKRKKILDWESGKNSCGSVLGRSGRDDLWSSLIVKRSIDSDRKKLSEGGKKKIVKDDFDIQSRDENELV